MATFVEKQAIEVQNVYETVPAWVKTQLNRIERKLDQLQKEAIIMEQEFTDLIAEVNEVKTVQASAALAITTLVEKFNQAIQAATSLAEAKAAAAQLKIDLQASTADLSAAIANVPA